MLKRMPHLVLSLLLLCISSLNAQASVLQLTDATFEGATQASTGQTTGHWYGNFVVWLVVVLHPADS